MPPAQPDRVGPGTFNSTWSANGRRVTVTGRGDIVISDDDTRIETISERGYLHLEEFRDGTRRRIEVEPGPDGRLKYDYFVGWTRREFDAEAQKWLAELLPALIRRTGLFVEARVARILARQGPAGVLDEISRLESDYVRARYFDRLLKARPLDPETRLRAVRQAGREIRSDYELASLLVAFVASAPLTTDLHTPFAAAVGTIQSSYERRRVLSAVVSRADASPDTISMALETAKGISSDHELASLLTKTLEVHPVHPTWRDTFLAASDQLRSQYELGRVTTAFVRRDRQK